jgi:hypothetical protein
VRGDEVVDVFGGAGDVDLTSIWIQRTLPVNALPVGP